MDTRPHAVTETKGRTIRFFMSAGQVRDHTGAAALLGGLPAAQRLLADRGHDANWFHETSQDKRIRTSAPAGCKARIPHLAPAHPSVAGGGIGGPSSPGASDQRRPLRLGEASKVLVARLLRQGAPVIRALQRHRSASGPGSAPPRPQRFPPRSSRRSGPRRPARRGETRSTGGRLRSPGTVR